MDILNFISWIKGGRVVTSVNPSQTLIPVGLKDNRRGDDYLAGAISVDDLAAQMPAGPQGPQGPIGATGLQGVAGPVGPAGLNWQGAWSALGTYVIDDAVGFGGASWFCINAVGPSVTTPDLDPTNWALLASQGSPGVNGGTGPQGIAGPNLVTTGTTLANIGSAIQVLYSNGVTVKGDPRFIYDETLSYFNHSGKTTDTTNTAMGTFALSNNVTGNHNTTVGYAAGNVIQLGNDNTAVGYQSLSNTSTGNNNTAIGSQALLFNTSSNNTAVGSSTLAINTTGSNNTAMGSGALGNNSTGFSNTAIGRSALSVNTAGINNTAIGYNALQSTTGLGNTAIGTSAASANTSGFLNTIVGLSAQTGNFNGSVILGANAVATGNNQFVVGSTGTNAGIVTLGANTSTKVWEVVINGVAQKVLLV